MKNQAPGRGGGCLPSTARSTTTRDRRIGRERRDLRAPAYTDCPAAKTAEARRTADLRRHHARACDRAMQERRAFPVSPLPQAAQPTIRGAARARPALSHRPLTPAEISVLTAAPDSAYSFVRCRTEAC